MADFDLKNISGEKIGTVDLNDGIFFGEIKENLFYETVKNQLAGRRAGTHSTKERADVHGGGAKPYRQKGTGRARAGTIRAPGRVGGGTVFGPHPRDYAYKIPKKMRRAAMRSALSLKRRENQLIVVDDLKLEEHRTKTFLKLAENLGLDHALLVVPEYDRNLDLASRNLKGFKVLLFEGLNVYDILKFDQVVLTKECLELIEGAYAG